MISWLLSPARVRNPDVFCDYYPNSIHRNILLLTSITPAPLLTTAQKAQDNAQKKSHTRTHTIS